MPRILINYAHRHPEQSRFNRALLDALEGVPDVTINDLARRYPDLRIDGARERDLLLEHDVIVLHFPFYW